MMKSGAPPVAGEGVERPATRRLRFVVPILSLLCVGAWPTAIIDTRAIAAAIQDPLSVFARRSPGDRVVGAQSKKGKLPGGKGTLVQRAPGKERVLSSGRSRPAPPIEVAGTDLPGGVVSPGAPGDAGPFPIGEGGFVSPYLPEGIGGGGGGGFFLPPVSNGPGVGVIGEPPGGGPILEPPTPPIPEPETWLTMMLGLLVIGGALRRRRGVGRSLTLIETTSGQG